MEHRSDNVLGSVLIALFLHGRPDLEVQLDLGPDCMLMATVDGKWRTSSSTTLTIFINKKRDNNAKTNVNTKQCHHANTNIGMQ